MSKLTKFYLIKVGDLEAWVEKETVKKISENKSIFKFSSLKLATIFKILQKVNYFAQK